MVLFRSITIVLATVLLAGCGGEQPGQPPPATAAPDIELWHIQTQDPTLSAVAAAAARFRAANANPLQLEAIKNDPFKTKLAAAMGAGTPPSVFHTWGGGVLGSYVAAGRVRELGAGMPEAAIRFHPAALAFCRHRGGLYALPVDVTVVPFWYNKKIFAEAGLTPPTTMTEFLTVCEQLRQAGKTPVALGNAGSWPGAFYFIYLATRAGGTEPIAQGRFEDPAFISAGEWIQRLVAARVFNDGFNGLDYDAARRLFFNGDAAMILMGTWLLAHARQEAPELLPDIGCFAFPGLGKDPAWDEVVVGGVNAAYAASASADATATDALLRQLTNDEAMKDWAATGRIPALPRDRAEALIAPSTRPAAEILWRAETLQLYYDQLLSPRLASAHKETCQALFAGTMTPAAAAAEMARTAAAMRDAD